MNPYYCETFWDAPEYYYDSPFEEEQKILKKKIAITNDVECQTQREKQQVVLNQFSGQLKGKQSLLDLIDANVSRIQENKKCVFQPYGIICLPELSLYINSCHVKVICSRLDRISSKVLYVPFFGNDLSRYIDVIFSGQVAIDIKQEFCMANKGDGHIIFKQSHNYEKFHMLALHSLEFPWSDYIKGMITVLKQSDKKNFNQVMIPFIGFEGCEKKLVEVVVGFPQTQKIKHLNEIIINCQNFSYFERVNKELMSIMKNLNKRKELTL